MRMSLQHLCSATFQVAQYAVIIKVVCGTSWKLALQKIDSIHFIF
jgi:hypothetical protein